MNILIRSLLISLGLSFAMAAPVQAQSYSWTTIAGLSLQSGSADGTNNDVRFHYPRGLALDNFGALYVADASNDTIRKLTPAGDNWVSSTLAGAAGSRGSADGTNSDALFNLPAALAVDADTNVFVLDTWNHTVRKMSPEGTNWVVRTLAGLAGTGGSTDGTNSVARFAGPQGIAVDPIKNLFVGDTFNNTVRELVVFGTNWVVTTIAGVANTAAGSADGTNSAALFNEPFGVAVDHANNLYVADYQNNTIRRITPVGTNWVVTTLAGSPGVTGTNDGVGNGARFAFPIAIAIDDATNLYVADSGNNLIRMLSPAGTNWVVSTLGGLAGVAGSVDGIGSAAEFNSPSGIAVGKEGNLYVADNQNHTIRLGRAPPSLAISLTNGTVELSWPSWATNYWLETSAALTSDARWSLMTNGVAVSSKRCSVTMEPGTAAALFRLHP